jgi:excinuclease UvrABC nuclease subunit
MIEIVVLYIWKEKKEKLLELATTNAKHQAGSRSRIALRLPHRQILEAEALQKLLQVNKYSLYSICGFISQVNFESVLVQSCFTLTHL